MQSLSGLESPHTYSIRKLKIFNSRISLHGFSTQSRHMAPDHINENHRELQIAFSRVDRHSVTTPFILGAIRCYPLEPIRTLKSEGDIVAVESILQDVARPDPANGNI